MSRSRQSCGCWIQRPDHPPFWETWVIDPECKTHGLRRRAFDPVANARAAMRYLRSRYRWRP